MFGKNWNGIRLRVVESPRDHLCRTCTQGRVSKTSVGDVQTSCSRGMSNTLIKGFVVECSAYDFEFQYADSRMSEQAWILERRGKTIIGFRPPEKREP